MNRSVSNMTTEQLYRKRAFDRLNQRQSRARKKTRIAELEDEVADLRKRLARSEDLVRRLQSSEAALREAINSARSSLRVPDPATLTSTPPDTAVREGSPQHLNPSPSSPLSDSSEQRQNLATRQTFETLTSDPPAFALRDEDTGLTLGFQLGEGASLDPMFHYWDDGFDRNAMNTFSLSFLDSLSPESLMDSWISSGTLPHVLMPITPHEPRIVPHWERLPIHVGASCQLDTVLLGLLESSRNQVHDHDAISELSNQTFPSIASLLNPETQSARSPISNAIGRHGLITMQVPSLPLKLAIMYNMCVLLRWMISPTKRNYDALPEYMRPRESQLTVPHPFWIDTVVWPEARERIIKSMDWSEFPIFRALGKSISINWPHPQSCVFANISPTELGLNPAFESHIRNIWNWTWGPEVAERFSFLDCVPTRVQA